MIVFSAKLLRDLMQKAAERRSQTEAYRAYLGRKVAAARASVRAGHGRSNEEVEAEFAAWRRQTLTRFVIAQHPPRA
jgi:hypothetical protein